ncbi:RNA pseudouridine synthase [Opisthorchis viverrini]|uniref:Pseudouridylate synthase RPUSD4, mitochondrial n=1 Tax=Opisthorchis viverrini TaxID=6198 RepID=A0A1S8X5I7_OPIVI|nr:RNA pseudouridine synthase [Opisthorchis viverrini]
MWFRLLILAKKEPFNKHPLVIFQDFFGIEKDQEEQEVQYRKAKELTSQENTIDQQYFGNVDERICVQQPVRPFDKFGEPSESLSDKDLEEIDQQYFGSSAKIASGPYSPSSLSVASDLHDVEDFIDRSYFGVPEGNDPLPNVAKTLPSNRSRKQTFPKEKSSPLQSGNSCDIEEGENEDSVRISDVVRDVRERTRVNLCTAPNLELPFTKEKKDFKDRPVDGKNSLLLRQKDSINFSQLTEDEAASVLAKSVIEVRAGPGLKNSIIDLLPRLEHRVRKLEGRPEPSDDNIEEFLLAHRLDKECTGVMLVARNRDACLKLQEAFARHWFEKNYLCITSGIPKTAKGVIQLPLVEKNFNGVYKMCVLPLNRHVQSESRDALRSDLSDEADAAQLKMDLESDVGEAGHPSTHYEMLDRKNAAALLICSATQGLKHQIRVHLSMGLHTPILGDHKYSHVKYLAPQRLSHRLLEQLNIRQSKVRHLPLYLHASSLRLSQSGQMAGKALNFMTSKSKNGQSFSAPIDFFAPPPAHFLEMLRLIGLKLPRHLAKPV